MTPPLEARIETVLGVRVRAIVPLHGGCIAEVRRIDLEDGSRIVAKCAHDTDLTVEAWMLGELARTGALPVPRVFHAEPGLLLLEYVPHDAGAPGPAAQRHAAERLAALHAVPRPFFGCSRDTLIGPLCQPNPRSERWIPFFRDHRLLYMAAVARRGGALPGQVFARIERLALRLEELLVEPRHPSLLHGDVWSGNLLVRGDRIAAFLDPALYCGHPEIEIAFTTLFGPFTKPFYDAYAALAGLDRDFWKLRRDVYNLYPLLVHLHLFGRGYLPPILRTLERCGL